MMRSKPVIFAVLLMLSVFAASACRKADGGITVAPAPGTSAELPRTEEAAPGLSQEPSEQIPGSSAGPVTSQQQTPNPTAIQGQEYVVEDDTIYLQTAQEKRLVYNAVPYYKAGAVCHIWNLSVEEGVLYFIETGCDPDDDGTNMKWSIIRSDQHGRHVLDTDTGPFGYDKFILYQDRVIYAVEGGDSCGIDDVKKDGSGRGTLMEAFTQEQGYPYFGYVEFTEDGNRLVIEGDLYLMRETEWLEGNARLIIYPDLRVELVWLSVPDTFPSES